MESGKMNTLNVQESYKLVENSTVEEKKQIMVEVDEAFAESIVYNKKFTSLFIKICENAFFISIKRNDEICAYAAMYANDKINEEAYISLIAVKKKYQNKHVGTMLINRCFEYARDQGMKLVKLEVKKENYNAIRFYRNKGFVFFSECSRDSDYYVCRL